MRSSPATVRRATRSDIGSLVGLTREFYAESLHPLDERWAARAFAQLLERPDLGCVWLAESGDVAAGHAVLTVRYSMETGALIGHIDDLFVMQQSRRQGIGHALLTELFAECGRRRCESVRVEVANRNAPAIELYRRFGLEPFADGRLLFHGSLGAMTATT
jgi:ribosomal protein S18 acetylase RimI-like enzyme